jgi:hypothetical protein
VDSVEQIFVYKRTHNGDPDDESGCFGIYDCMGSARGYGFDAVIGVGGVTPDRGFEEIACRVNWIGIGPRCVGWTKRGPQLGFAHFVGVRCFGFDLGANPADRRDLWAAAPALAQELYKSSSHFLLLRKSADGRAMLYTEAEALLKLAERASPSGILTGGGYVLDGAGQKYRPRQGRPGPAPSLVVNTSVKERKC